MAGRTATFSCRTSSARTTTLTFPRGTVSDARAVVKAYQDTFGKNAAAMLLVWGLGAHQDGAGLLASHGAAGGQGNRQSTVIKRLERSIAFTMFSGQSLQTEFRLITSVSHTSHPVGWEELSARRQDVIDKAVAILRNLPIHGEPARLRHG